MNIQPTFPSVSPDARLSPSPHISLLSSSTLLIAEPTRSNFATTSCTPRFTSAKYFSLASLLAAASDRSCSPPLCSSFFFSLPLSPLISLAFSTTWAVGISSGPGPQAFASAICASRRSRRASACDGPKTCVWPALSSMSWSVFCRSAH